MNILMRRIYTLQFKYGYEVLNVKKTNANTYKIWLYRPQWIGKTGGDPYGLLLSPDGIEEVMFVENAR